MKIALVYDSVYPWMKGGGEKTLYELACELRDRGHEVHLFGMQLWDGPRDIEREGLHYHALCSAMAFYAHGGKRRVGQPLRYAWGMLWRLPRYRLREFDVIDLHAFPFLSTPAFWLVHLLFARRVPWLLTWLEVWGADYWRRHRKRLAWLGAAIERLTARLGPAHLCISPTTARRLHEMLGVLTDRITVIPRGFSPPASLPTVTRQPHKAVVAGRMHDYKRFDLPIRAWPAVRASVPDAELHVIGDGPELDACRQLAASLGVADSVHFRGQLPDREQVLAEIASAGLLLQPSTREGQSTVVLEAMWLGTPVLAAQGPETAVADLLGDSDDARRTLLPVASGPEAWAQQIVQCMREPALLASLVTHHRQRAEQLEWQHLAPQVESLYQRLIERR